MKHVGIVGQKPCIVLFREVPSEPENCLVVKTDSLEPDQHDALMNVVQSPEAQESNELSEVLNRRTFPDGSNMLTSLHYGKKIEKVSDTLVELTPTPSQKVSLTEVKAEIAKINNASNPPLKTEVDPNAEEISVTTANVEGTPANAEGDAPQDVAQSILVQADLMTEDANRMLAEAEAKRQEAYSLNPALKPKKGPGRPKKS